MSSDYADRAERYARRVVGGEIPAALPPRLACQRHLDDLAAAESPYRFDPAAANRVCGFIELLPHTKGRWAQRKEKIRLEDWQCFILCVVFGWLRKLDGLRRFRRVYIEVPRKNGKSAITAAVGLHMFANDGEYGAEVYSGSGTEKQAWEVFGPARLMAKNTPALLEAFGIAANAKNLHILGTASKFEPIIGKPGDGASPSFAITDEYHEHQTDDQYDTMLTGMGAREQPIAWVITTAGSDTAGPCYAQRSEVMDVLSGTVENDELFGIIYTVDDGDDWTSEAALQKANPNLGVSVSLEFLQQQQRDAVNSPRKQSTFKTKHLNLWVTAASPFFNLEKWNRLADTGLQEVQFLGVPCWGGLDLASKIDLAAEVKLFRRDEGPKPHWYVFGRYYIPEERAEDPDKKHYAGWVEQGHLVATPGNVTDYDAIEAGLKADAERYTYAQIGVDPYNATQIMTHLSGIGLEVVEVPQTVAHLSEAMKQVQAVIEDGRIHHDGNPVLAWAIGNVTAQVDRNDNVFPRKERLENKIDPAVALIIAMGRAMSGEGSGFVYHDRGIEVWG